MSPGVERPRHQLLPAYLCNALAAAAGLLVLAGWQLDIDPLKSVVPGFITMKANTAVGLMALAIAGLLQTRRPVSPAKRAAAAALSLLAIGIGAATLSEYLFGLELGLDELLYKDPAAQMTRWPPGRLAPITAINFLLVGSALLGDRLSSPQAKKVSQALLLTTWVVSFQAFIGYLAGVTYSFGSAYYTQIAVHTAALFIAISTGILLSRSDEGYISVLAGRTTAGAVGRKLLAAGVVVPPLVNLFQLAGDRLGLFDADFGVLLRVVGNVVFFSWMAFQTGASLLESERQRAEVEENFRRMADTMPQLVWTSSPDGAIDYANRRWYEYTGLTEAQTVGGGWTNAIHPDDRANVARRAGIALRTLQLLTTELRLGRADGTYRWHLARGLPVRDASGAVRQWLGTMTEIEDQKQALAAVEQSRALLTLITDALPDFVSYIGASGRYQFANKTYAEWLGVPSEELSGKTSAEIFGEESSARSAKHKAAALRGERVRFETTLRRSSGQRVDLDITYVPDLEPATGKARGFVIIGHDITARKRSIEEARFLSEATRLLAGSLHHEENFAQLAWLSVPALGDVCAYDVLESNGKVRRVATAAVESAEAPPGAGDRSAIPLLEPADSRSRPFLATILTGQPQLDAAFVDGGLRSLLSVPLLGAGATQGAISFCFAEGTPRRHTQADLALAEELARRVAIALANARLYQEARQAVRARDDLLSICSHELRTPVTGMKLQTELMRRQLGKLDPGDGGPEKLQKLVGQTDRQLDRLTKLIEEMLDFSRISGGRLPIKAEPLDLTEVVRTTVDWLRPQCVLAGCTVDLDAPAPVLGNFDRFRLEQVLTNLLTNAVRYGAGKPIHVRLTEEEGCARLSVRDQGMGIAAVDQARIFEPYERAVPASSISGLGLGLYIARHIVNAHGGTLTVESVVGRGSVFRADFPLVAAARPALATR